MENYLTWGGLSLIVVYMAILLIVFRSYANAHYKNTPLISKYFRYGVLVKLFAGIGFALIFDFYYGRGGDSFSYFGNSCRLGMVLSENPLDFFKMLFGFVNSSNIHSLDPNISYIPNLKWPVMYATHRFISPFTILGFRNYYVTIICLNVVLFIFNWRVFMHFNKLFPDKTKILAICLLFIPSALFWGSGIVKDSFTYVFTLLFIVYFHKIFMLRKLKIFNVIKLLLCVYILVSLKPYILYSALASCFIWAGLNYTQQVKSRALRVFVLPIAMIAFGLGGMYVLNNVMNQVGGAYKDVDSMLNKAVVSQQDLKRDYYKGSSFDIGDYDATIQGAASVTPAAIIAGLYRPFIWEARSAVMVLSGIENLVLLLLTLYILLRAGPIFFLRQISLEPFLMFCFIFALVMAMGIGLSTSNFGALVRFRIPLLPFFFLAWLFIYDNYRKKKLQKENKLSTD